MNITTCAMQDFMTRMNHYDSVLLSYASPFDRSKFNHADAEFARSLHDVMGYRQEHLQEEGF